MSSTQRFPRFTTFKPGELDSVLREHLKLPREAPLPLGSTQQGSLVKEHSFAVTFPDRTEGTCRYEWRGPNLHRFHYSYRDGVTLPRQWWTSRLANYLPTIEGKGKELASVSYLQACTEEQDRYFKRASFPLDGTRPKHPERVRLSVARAKELSGRYALSLPHGTGLIAISATYPVLAEANTAWKEQQNERLVVACCNRLHRCWELPKFNPLYAEFDPRVLHAQKGELPWSLWK